MTSRSGIWKPTASEKEKKIADSCEVTALALKAGGGAAVIALYDGVDSTCKNDQGNLKWVLDASTTDSDNQSFSEPIIFKRGMYAVCEQGELNNPILCVATRRNTP